MSVSGGQESCKLAGDSRHGGCFVDVNLDVLWEKERKRNKMEMVDPQNIASANVCHPKRSRSFGALHKTRACASYDVILGLLRFSTYVTALSE